MHCTDRAGFRAAVLRNAWCASRCLTGLVGRTQPVPHLVGAQAPELGSAVGKGTGM